MLTAIQIGSDSVLLQSRAAILETAGVRLVNAEGFPQGLERIRDAPFDLAVLCHSLSRTDRLNLAAAIRRRNPSAAILLVSSGPGAPLAEKDGMDAVLESEPHRLLQGFRLALRSLEKKETENRSEKTVRPEAG
ncbi:MAG: hypothetical protein WCB76_11395 [Acidobacteriaceae bacterium]